MGTLYPSVSVSGYNANPPPDDGTQTAANQVLWSTIKQKLPDPLKTAIEAINTALVAALDFSVTQKTSAYTTTAADHMRIVEVAPSVSSAVTISLGDAATMTNKYWVIVKNSGTSTVTVTRATGGDTIDGVAGDLTLAAGQGVLLSTTNGADGYITLTGLNYASGTLTVQGAVQANSGTTAGLQLENNAGTVYTPRVTNDANDATVIRPGASGAQVLINNFADNTTLVSINDAGGVTFAEPIAIGNVVNEVSPTSPNRTFTIIVDGVTLYVHAKTSND